MSEEKYCCDKFTKWTGLGWFFAPEYEDFKWHISTGSCGEVSYDIPIDYCPFCGSKLNLDKVV